MVENLVNDFATALVGNIDASQVSIEVAENCPVSANFRVRLNDELMLVTANATPTWTVVRGVEGTTARAHTSGVPVIAVLTAEGFEQWAEDRFPNDLGSAAFEDTSAFDPAGAAATAESNANAHTDALAGTLGDLATMDADSITKDVNITGDGSGGIDSAVPRVSWGVEVGGNNNAHGEICSPADGVAYIDFTVVNVDIKTRMGWWDGGAGDFFIIDTPHGDLTFAGGAAAFSVNLSASNLSGTNTGDQTANDISLDVSGGFYSATHVDGALIELLSYADSINSDVLTHANDTSIHFTAEQAQDAVGAMVDSTLEYVDATPLLKRAALTGAITASSGSNTTALGSFTKAQLDAAISDGNALYTGDDHGSLGGLTDDDHTQYMHGESSSTDNQLVRWDGTGGRDVQDSVAVLSDAGVLTGITAFIAGSTTSLPPVAIPAVYESHVTAVSFNALYGGWGTSAVPVIGFTRSRGASVNTHTIMQAGDVIGAINFYGSDGTDAQFSCAIQAYVTGTPANNDIAGKLSFQANGAGGTSGERAYVDANGLFSPTVREKLRANRTYYVRTDGSNSNTGLVNSSGGAFLTIQKAVDVVVGTLDLGGFTVTIQVGNGTYTSGFEITTPVVGGILVVQGDTTTPSNVVVSTTSAHGFLAVSPGVAISVKGFKITVATSGYALVAGSLGVMRVTGKMEYGACATGHLLTDGGQILITGDYTISGNSPYHLLCANMGKIQYDATITVTVSGTPAFATAFVTCVQVSYMGISNGTFSGSATGPRYFVGTNSVVVTSGVALPGNAGGSTGTGGQYV